MKKLSLIVVLSLLVSVLGFQSCMKEDQALKAPKLPDTRMIAMDFNGFDTVDPDQRSFSNWFHAAVNVYFWTRTVAEVLKVPVTALVVALHQEPIYQGEDTWMWTFTVNDNTGEYVVELYGTLTQMEEVNWAMYVTKTGEFNDFLWFTGATAYDESYSNWMLNTFAADLSPVEFLKIEYQQDMDSDTEQIRYTNIIPGDPGNGGYIQYGTMVGEDFPVFYDVYNKKDNNYTLIQFDPQSKFGRVKDQKRFHDEVWHCWDNHTNDIDCE